MPQLQSLEFFLCLSKSEYVLKYIPQNLEIFVFVSIFDISISVHTYIEFIKLKYLSLENFEIMSNVIL